MANSIKSRIYADILEQMSGGELQKALTTTGDGAALLPYDLDPILHEELLKLQPLAVLMDIIEAGGKTHEYNVRSSHPMAWFEGEVTPQNNKNSVYARKSVQMKIQRIWGSVSGFAQAMDERFIDALATELEGSLEGMANILEYGFMWGAADDLIFTGDPYQYSGMIPRIFAYAPENIIDGGGNKITLDDLDAAIAKAVGFRGVRGDPKLWLMGTRMKQIVDGLQTKVQIPLTEVVLADGKIAMAAYDNIPILESDYIVPVATTTSPAATATAAAGGSLIDDEYFYVISSVTYYGEQVAGVEDSATTSATNNTVNLTWTADANAVLYMIWRGLATGNANLKLLDIIPALTYDGNGTVNGTVEAYADDGSIDTGAGATLQAIKPLSVGEQNILMVNYNSVRGAALLGKVDDMGRPTDRLFSFVELARVKDTFDYMLKGYLSARLVHPNLQALVRHVKLA
jgi:hypothetical protein